MSQPVKLSDDLVLDGKQCAPGDVAFPSPCVTGANLTKTVSVLFGP